ncbi:MAG: polyprenyl synthetase family protein [Planctomycetaceae bacterium]|jgi:geranylgeranyl diphosphate synthase type II|nr:polyprenyl synthetase family protein [Planctomycetaceae bacterium]
MVELSEREKRQISDYLELLRGEINTQLDKYTDFGERCPQYLAEPMRYSLLSTGKRIRPTLTLLACELCGTLRSHAIPAACAIEMIHTYSLIHDDLPALDNDDLRRGQLTCHIKYDESSAILAGDALQAYAYEVISKHIFPKDIAGRCVAILAEACGPCDLVGGQADDMAWKANGAPSLEFLESIHQRKTGSMILAGLRMGATIGGASRLQMEKLEEYGRNYGLAFQITDDLLDVTGDEETTGKHVRKDISQGKLTFPSFLGVDESRKQAYAKVRAACDALDIFKSDSIVYKCMVGLTQHLLDRKK